MSNLLIFLLTLLLLALLSFLAYTTYTHLRARRLGLPPPRLNPFSHFLSSHSSSNSSSRFYATPRSTSFSPRSTSFSPRSWFSSALNALRGGNDSGGGRRYGGFGGSARRSGGFGALDPDEAWDARVGAEAEDYYEGEELEAGMGGYGGGMGGAGAGAEVGVVRGPGVEGRELDRRYEEVMRGETGRGQRGRGERGDEGEEDEGDPFGDERAVGRERVRERERERDLRGVSPRPMDGRGKGKGEEGGRGRTASEGSEGLERDERSGMFTEVL